MMKRVWKLSHIKHFAKPYAAAAAVAVDAGDASCRRKIRPFPDSSIQRARGLSTESTRTPPTWPDLVGLFADKFSYVDSEVRRDLRAKVSELRDELAVLREDDVVKVEKVLDERGAALFRRYSDGLAVVELLTQLDSHPRLSLEVLNWRRRQFDYRAPMSQEEYAKGIMVAGRLKDIDLAVELFTEASNRQLKTISVYNALMGAYMYNGFAAKCQSLFQELKMEATCSPSIVTYNILISVFGRSLMVDKMEAIFREITDMNLSPNVKTYNNLIAGYLTAWMWGAMKRTYVAMQASGVEPDITTYLLMLRGYAHSGKLDKMEETYDLVKAHVNQTDLPLIRSMICAYCRSPDVNRVTKVKELLKLIPEDEYKPWLNVLIICLYAKEDLLEEMENSIRDAFEHKTNVITVGAMRCIIASYFRHNAVDRLANFIKQAEACGWKICRSLYHCKMVMYATHRRLTDMERVLDEMDRMNIDCSKKTFWILYKAYSRWGQTSKLQQVVGMMCKHGYGIPFDSCSS